MAGLGTWKLAGVLQDMLVNNKTRRIVATVQRIEDGVTWVVPSGMKDAVPVNGSQVVSAEVDEQVIVEIENGRLSLTGNATAPAVGGTYVAGIVEPVEQKATNALEEAQRAHDAADAAETDAKRAAVAAESAENSAADAATAATAAQGSASTAAGAATQAQSSAAQASSAATQAQADASTAAAAAGSAAISAASASNSASQAASDATSANRSANNALTQLSIVQDVAGTLSWISQHGTYTATTDTSVVDGRVYFELVDGDYVPIVGPSGNPSQQGWYVLDVTDAVSDYLMAHLAVTSAGLWVLPSGMGQSATPQSAPGYKLLLASDGMTVYDASGAQVVKYGSSIELGGTRAFHLGTNAAYILFYDSNNDGTPDSIRIGGANVTLGSSKKLEDLLDELDGVRSDLDGLEIGGRNLLTDTSDEWHEISLSASQWFYEAHTGYELEIGETYTFSIIVEKVSTDSVPIHLHLGNGINGQYTHDIIGWRKDTIPFGERVSLTYTITEADLARTSSDTTVAPFLSWRLRNEQHATTIRYRCVKLERGNKPTDWTPAPEDVDEDIEDAKTTATRYITNITDGIFVAPEGQGPNDTQTPTGWRIKDALELIKSGISVFRVWLEGGLAKVRIGESDGNHALLDGDSFDIYHDETQMAHFGYGDGNASSGTGTAPYYTLGRRADTTTNVYSSSSTYSVGARVLYDNEEYICIRAITTPEAWTAKHWQRSIGNWSVAVGNRVTASGYSSYAEGNGTTAIGGSSHAEGSSTFVSGIGSHAEGSNTSVSGYDSHAEGYKTTVSGDYSHAEGSYTTASGNRSHVQNLGTVAAYNNQTAIGKYNDNQSTNAFEIGNGTDGNPSNAFAVDWNGNVPIAGDVQDVSGALRYAPIAYGSLTGMASALTLTTSAQKLPLGGTFVGNECSESSNGVMVEEAGTYMITGSAYLFGGYTANDIVHLLVHVGATEVADCLFRATTTNPYQTISTAPVVVQLAANTVVTMHAYNQVAARGTINSKAGHGLTVLRIA